MQTFTQTSTTVSNFLNAIEILQDYRLVCESRQASLIGRKEVFAGKAKFGIFGDGKELPQIALSRFFQNGDFRSGYYRDQTIAFAIGALNYEQFFAQLYAHASETAEPASAGRMMNAHFGTRLLDEKGHFLPQTNTKNIATDLSPTAGQMPRLVGLGYASKLYRQNPNLHQFTDFSINGNEIAFGTIGNASTSEGLFWEAMNAIGVLQVPVVMSVWDDEYGISVGKEHHTVRESISKALSGFQKQNPEERGFEIFEVKAWDYVALMETYQKATEICRNTHTPVLVHVTEVTQQQGHSTSGSHERYKSKERLAWEKEFDCNVKFRNWIEKNGYATSEQLDEIEKKALETINKAKKDAWKAFNDDLAEDRNTLLGFLGELESQFPRITMLKKELQEAINPTHTQTYIIAKKAFRVLKNKTELKNITSFVLWFETFSQKMKDTFNSHLHSQSDLNANHVQAIAPTYASDAPMVDGREVLQANFDKIFSTNPLVIAFGEDVGKIGDVNQGFAGLQEKYGEIRISDTSIREATIIGQGIGTALRGLRPIAEIQYLDYMLYALQIMSDDVACLQYRSKGGQKVPLIVRTRGHRLEGVWHSGSPIGMLLHSLRGMYIAVPRNMTQASGFYNTFLKSDEPALIIECLNGYRLKEQMPDNLGEFTVPVGVPEILYEGTDVTIVTYGSMCRLCVEASEQLAEVGISVEVIDVQTLLPFDKNHNILKSIQKTNRVIFADEDVSGGATAFMMREVLEVQNAYKYLDSKPICISAQDHRPAYGSDGDYFSKPNLEHIFDVVFEMMQECEPERFD